MSADIYEMLADRDREQWRRIWAKLLTRPEERPDPQPRDEDEQEQPAAA